VRTVCLDRTSASYVSTLPRTQLHQLAILQVIKVFDDAMMITSQPLAAPLVCSFETTPMLQHVQERSGHLGNRAGYRYPGACIFPNETLAVMIGHRCDVPPDTWLPLGVIPVHPHLPFQVCGCPPKMAKQTTTILTRNAQQGPTGCAFVEKSHKTGCSGEGWQQHCRLGLTV
jgi:hypothetical protein